MAELAEQVRESHNRQEPIARSAVEYVRLTIEDIKESLVDATGDDMLRLQGAARHLQKLHKELTQTPPNISRSE